ncbi:MAG: alpha/beta fold hydrolase [Myxococcota bacterium]
MHVQVNGVRLFFDVEGAKLVPDGATLREKPTLVLLHGGPGLDHSSWKPDFSRLTDLVQLVYVDHRGNGRSDRSTPEHWSLDQWADDVRGLCDALGIERPIVMGTSFGGMVAMAYATRHPEHPARLIFSSTSPRQNLARMLERFEARGGPEARRAAERFWTDPGPETLPDYLTRAMPLYNARAAASSEALRRSILNLDLLYHFARNGVDFDLRPGLANVRCPTLVLGGALDPVCPIEDQEEIVAALRAEHVRFERFEDAGHGVFRDEPERAFAVLRDFLAP